MKPFTTLTVLLLLLVAAAHIYRLATDMVLDMNGTEIPMWASIVAAAVSGALGVMTWIESRK